MPELYCFSVAHRSYNLYRYGLREALAIVAEEGLEQLWARHQRLSQDLLKGLAELGLEPFVEAPKDRLSTVNTIKVRANSQPVLDAIYRFTDVSSAQFIDNMH